MLMLINVNTSYGQKLPTYSFRIVKGSPYTSVLESFIDRYRILIAYSPTLLHYNAPETIVLQSEDPGVLFEKVCHTFQLDFIREKEGSYLVRTVGGDLESSDFMMLHLRLTESGTGQPLAYAAVYDPAKKYFGFTDEQGDCFIRLPKSARGGSLKVHSLAYTDQTVSIPYGTDTYKEVSIRPEPVKVMPVTISSIKKNLSLINGQSMYLSSAAIDKLYGSNVFQKDVLRTLQMMPGVSAINDSKSSIRIRGANEEATLLVLDKMPVYRADHFYGIFGAFNSWYIKNINLYKNNLPVEYGGRTSGMLKMDSGSKPDKFNLNVDLNLLNTGLMGDLPLSKNLAVRFSARTTFTDLANSGFNDLSQRENLEMEHDKPRNEPNNIVSRPDFDFYDANGRLFFKNGRHSFDANIFQSQDQFSQKYSKVFIGKVGEKNDEIFSQTSKWENITYGLNYTYAGKKTNLAATLYRTSYAVQYDIASTLMRKEQNIPVLDSIDIYNDNRITDTGLRLSLSQSRSLPWMIGLEHIIHDNNLYLENDRSPLFEISRKAPESSFFAQATFGGHTGFMAEPAIRVTRFSSTGDLYLLPQVYLRYYFGENFFLKSSAGRQAQFVRQIEHENILGQSQQFFAISNGTTVPVGLGSNFMAGGWKSWGNVVLDVEAYYRTLDGAITHSTQRPGLRQPPSAQMPASFRLFTGESRSYGVDIAIALESKKLFSMFAYTLSKSENRYTNVFKNQYFPSQEDSRHQVKWVNTYSAGRFDFSANYIGATGRPYLDLSSIQILADRSDINLFNYLRNLPAYHRLDIGTFFKFRLGGMDSRAGVSVYNVFDRVNVKYRQFVFQLPNTPNNQGPGKTILGSDVAQLGRTVNLSLNFTIK